MAKRGKDASLVIIALLLIAALALAAYLWSRRAAPTPPAPIAQQPLSPDMLLGNPSSATSEPGNRTNYLMIKPHYTLAYNDETGTAKWVSWRVTRADLGDAPRKPTFEPDPELPANFFHVTSRDYAGSGFDRGHLCPHSDRAANIEMSYS